MRFTFLVAALCLIVPETRLTGRDQENDVVMENLASDALQVTVPRARFLAALTFRFGSNPFSGSTPDKPAAKTSEKKP
jgi:hypothetical protein